MGRPPNEQPATSPNTASVIVIEDDETIGRHLQAGLTAHGYRTRWARTGVAGIEESRAQPPDVVLLDLGLPDIDGVQVARTLRTAHPRVLLVILTARTDDLDVVIGLDAGADDYLTKPVRLTVLLARLRAHLRTRPPAAGPSDRLRIGALTVDPDARRCLLGDRELDLRPKEFDLLLALARRPGTAVSRHELMSQVWDENWFGSTKTLDVTMAALRRRLVDQGTENDPPPAITTLRGHGYRLEDVPVR